jgi:hypothetical protein
MEIPQGVPEGREFDFGQQPFCTKGTVRLLKLHQLI